jgi:hypothetical protein
MPAATGIAGGAFLKIFGLAARRWLRPTVGLLPFKQPTPDQFAGFIEGEAPPFHQIVCRSQTLAVQQLLLDVVGKSGGEIRGHGPTDHSIKVAT